MFDRYVADKRRRRPLLYVSLVASAILQGSLIVFLIIYSFLHVEEVQPPPLTVQFFSSAPPPPPPPPPPKAKKVTPKVVKPVVQPTAVPSQIVQPKEKEEKEEPDEGQSDGVPGGVPGGIPGGVGQAAPPPPPMKPKNVPAFQIKNSKLSGDDPHLPDVIKAQRRGQSVRGTYKICIDLSGHVNQVTALAPIPGGDEAIMATLRTWTFKPQPIPVCFVDVFVFEIQ